MTARGTTVMPEIEAEVCVLGGGPAGSVMAKRLAELGHDTLLIARSGERSRSRAESLAPSIFPILDSLELRRDVDAAVFRREERALLLWQAGGIMEKSFAGAPSLLVDRALLDALLRAAASRAGVRVLSPASARSPQRATSGGWTIPIMTGNGAAVVNTMFLVDARGKRRRMCIDDDAARTAALSASWTRFNRSYVQTRIEAGQHEWYWGSPLPNGRYGATVFLDSTRAAGLGADGRAKLYRTLLSCSTLCKDLLHGDMVGPVSVQDASSRIAGELIGNDFIRVGEAAFAIDPLSSQGIQTAVLSAIQGSTAAHTILGAGCDCAAAIAFYRERQHAAARRSGLIAARFYRAHLDRSSFWMRRSSAAGGASRDQRQARRAGSLPSELHLSQALRIVEVPVLAGELIRRAPALSHPQLEHAIAYFGGVALAPLIEDASATSKTERILGRWTKRMPHATARDIMSWMWAVGILVPQADAAPASTERQSIEP
jgi:flavin-dependent dehydrogenase